MWYRKNVRSAAGRTVPNSEMEPPPLDPRRHSRIPCLPENGTRSVRGEAQQCRMLACSSKKDAGFEGGVSDEVAAWDGRTGRPRSRPPRRNQMQPTEEIAASRSHRHSSQPIGWEPDRRTRRQTAGPRPWQPANKGKYQSSWAAHRCLHHYEDVWASVSIRAKELLAAAVACGSPQRCQAQRPRQLPSEGLSSARRPLAARSWPSVCWLLYPFIVSGTRTMVDNGRGGTLYHIT
jgi:hypothetical protein